MPLFAATIFCGAFLLFLVQPLMGKYLLPWFGGGPGVWTTCLLFFQTLLLGGYLHAHLLQRLSPRRQAIVHGGLLVVALAFLPVIPDAHWKPSGVEDPIGRILLLLTAVLGLPYLVLSATGPLVQRWFSLTHPGVSPYRLYALSNAGSLLALVAYPFFFEPRFSRDEIGIGWSAGLVVFAVLTGACAWRVARVTVSERPAAAPGKTKPANLPAPAALDRVLWIALPAVASMLLVATTNKLCLDIAAVPFLWVLPLGVYLVTFILCFDHPRWYHRGVFAALLALGCCLAAQFFSTRVAPLLQQAATFSSILFVGCMVCHGELYRLRPAPDRLTGYYLCIAAGGAAGSVFVALGAPLLFADFRELQLGLVLLVCLVGTICFFQRARAIALGLAGGMIAAVFVLPMLRADRGDTPPGWFSSFWNEVGGLVVSQWLAITAGLVVMAFAVRQGWRIAPAWRSRLVAVPLLLAGFLATVFIRQAREDAEGIQEASRNFYGAYKVKLFDYPPDPATHFFTLTNGGIIHGLQFRGASESRWPTTYYSRTSGVGRAFDVLPPRPRRIGAVGLGAGTVAAYGRPGDTFRFYEINPAIVTTAARTFTYLKSTRASISIALGDARLVMERELRLGQSQQFDLLVLDAFAGDAIPVHLLTREALAGYLHQLRPGGIIAVHISNRHVDLRPVVEALALDAGLHYATITDTPDKARFWLNNTRWVLLSTDEALLQREAIAKAADQPPEAPAKMVLWTDDHASLFDVITFAEPPTVAN